MPTRPTTAEQKDDAARLKALVDQWLEKDAKTRGTRLAQEELAALLGVGQSALSQRLNGKLAINRDFASTIAKLIGHRVRDFSPRLADDIDALSEGPPDPDHDEFAQVRRVDVSVSAGRGALVFEEPSRSALTFRRSFLQEVGVTPTNAVIVTVKGHSMDPTLPDGAVILVNTAAKTVSNGRIYAFRSDGALFVKRMSRTADGGYLATSDNPDREQFPDMIISAYDGDFEIIGRALWVGAKL